jgi:hypothetical protein
MLERWKMARLARHVVGLSAGPSTRAEFLDLIAGGETDAVAADMATLSTCGLVVRGLWRRFGMSDPRLEAPYVPASVIANIIAMAKEAEGWSDGWSSPPDVGDVLYMSAPDHVGTVVHTEPGADGGMVVVTVDGGTTDAGGYQSVSTYERAISPAGALLTGPLAGNGRTVYGVAHLPALASRFGGAGLAGVGLGTVAALGAVGLGAYALRHQLGRQLRRLA